MGRFVREDLRGIWGYAFAVLKFEGMHNGMTYRPVIARNVV